MMVGLLLFLLFTLSLPSTAEPDPAWQHVLMDISNCVNLRCEWRGVGKKCKSPTVLQPGGYGEYFDFLKDDESDDDLLTRIKHLHPLNTFVIVNNAELGEMCSRRRLWCNVAQHSFGPTAYEEFFDYLLSPGIPKALKPKLHC